eukprot:scaffold1875_cov339-Prasinococcus_capsulatus_cf.AAC.16
MIAPYPGGDRTWEPVGRCETAPGELNARTSVGADPDSGRWRYPACQPSAPPPAAAAAAAAAVKLAVAVADGVAGDTAAVAAAVASAVATVDAVAVHPAPAA